LFDATYTQTEHRRWFDFFPGGSLTLSWWSYPGARRERQFSPGAAAVVRSHALRAGVAHFCRNLAAPSASDCDQTMEQAAQKWASGPKSKVYGSTRAGIKPCRVWVGLKPYGPSDTLISPDTTLGLPQKGQAFGVSIARAYRAAWLCQCVTRM